MDKIAFIIKTFLNRTETFIYEPLKKMNRFEVDVICETKKNLDEFKYSPIWSMSDLSPVRQVFENLLAQAGNPGYYRDIIKKQGIKLIHAHFAPQGILMLGVKKKLKIPLITSFYGLDVYRYNKDPVFLWNLKKLFKKGDLFLAFCEKMRRDVIALGCPRDKIITHHGGADFSRFKFVERRPGNTFNMVLVGRCVEKKGIDYAIKAVQKVHQAFPQVELTIVGSGPNEKEYQELIKTLNAENYIKMVGAKSFAEYIDLLYRSDLMIAPSVIAKSGDEEGGINTTVIEAFATGLPCVATLHSGTELVTDDKTGYMVKEKDVDALAKTIIKIVKQPELIVKLGKAARALVEEEFDIVKQTEKLEGYYRDLIEEYAKHI